MQTILIANSKGGSGKTTLATNLASLYACKGFRTALLDYDPQGSALQWLQNRDSNCHSIYGANAAKPKGGLLRSWQMRIPSDVQKLVIDSPAGSNGILLQDLVKRADLIIIPVAPSRIDVHATAEFIKTLMLVGKVRLHSTKLAVVANRVRDTTALYQPLEKFLQSLSIPLVTKLSDSDRYVNAADQGLGIFEIDPQITQDERKEFAALIQWLENPYRKPTKPRSPLQKSPLTHPSAVVHLPAFGNRNTQQMH